MYASIAAWLGAIAGPIVTRVLVALGVGYVSYEGVTIAIDTALATAKASFGAMPGEVFQIIAIWGFFDFMSILCGAAVSGVAWMTLKKFALRATGA